MLCALSAKLVPLQLEKHFGNHVQGWCTHIFESSKLVSLLCQKSPIALASQKKNWHQVLSKHLCICCILFGFVFKYFGFQETFPKTYLIKQLVLKVYLDLFIWIPQPSGRVTLCFKSQLRRPTMSFHCWWQVQRPSQEFKDTASCLLLRVPAQNSHIPPLLLKPKQSHLAFISQVPPIQALCIPDLSQI